jgi:hypothetical protein
LVRAEVEIECPVARMIAATLWFCSDGAGCDR